jgi:hypothetical protein
MNNISHHSVCPICHNSYPTPALPAHLRAHAAAARAADLRRRSNQEIAEMLRVCVWAEMSPLAEETAIVEEAISRLEALA